MFANGIQLSNTVKNSLPWQKQGYNAIKINTVNNTTNWKVKLAQQTRDCNEHQTATETL